MASVTVSTPIFKTLDDLQDYLGWIPLQRIRLQPAPGLATERDMLALHDQEGRICEMIYGTLVEKPMGYFESRLAVLLGYYFEDFLSEHDLGIVTGEAGPLRLHFGLVRIPDVAFLSWDRFPNRMLPAQPIPDLVPDLAVEILSESNTKKEMQRKLQEYFAAGVRLVWIIDPKSRTAEVYTGPDQATALTEDDSLKGGDVLPGFLLPLRTLFTRAGQQIGE